MARERIVVAGAINTDLVAVVERAPEAGETVTGQTFHIYGGGKGANVAVAAQRAGADVSLVAAVGDDAFGRDRLRTVVEPTGWDIRDGYRSAQRLLGCPEPPTAILASNDRAATGVLLCATALGLRVPRDLTLVGVDDQQSVADQLVPSLTTVALPHRQIGERAVNLLLEQLGGQERVGRVERIDCPLIVRESSGPVPTR